MKKLSSYVIMAAFVLLYETGAFCMENISFEPINHATFVIKSPKIIVYVDPVGDKKAFQTFPEPDLILITDIHQDHLDPALVSSLKTEKTAVIGPEAVTEQLKYGTKLKNGETMKLDNISIEAVPAYNMTAGTVFPYHYRGKDGMSDLNQFESLVQKNEAIQVKLLNWYDK